MLDGNEKCATEGSMSKEEMSFCLARMDTGEEARKRRDAHALQYSRRGKGKSERCKWRCGVEMYEAQEVCAVEVGKT